MSKTPVDRIDPYAPTTSVAVVSHGEVASGETALSKHEASQYNLIPVVCGEYDNAIPAMVDTIQRIVVPVASK